MAIFFNQTKGYFLLTNFKVMYSTLSAQSNLQEIVLRNYLDCLKFKSQQRQNQTIMLVRNPYGKLISFFEDKFIRHPNMPPTIRAKYSDVEGWQACQRIFFPYLQIERQATDAAIAKCLKNTSFTQFITWLSEVYQQDEHLLPQTRAIDFQMSMRSLKDNSSIARPIKIKLKLDRTIKFEQLERNYLQHELNLDLSQIRNQNHHRRPWRDYYCASALLQIVNEIYQDDFAQFDYCQFQTVEQLDCPEIASSIYSTA